MSTTIVACTGQGSPWITTDPNNTEDTRPRCPSCMLTNEDLQIKIRTKNGKIIPAALPAHDIEVPGTELRYVLAGGDFKVHTPTCPSLKTDTKQSDYEKPAILVAADRRDAIMQLWDDQIQETEGSEDQNTDTIDAFLEEHGYIGATDFHSRCLGKVEGFRNGKTKATGAKGEREARRMLANLLIEAMAKRLEEIKDTNLADTEKETTDARLVLSAMSNAQIDKVASAWVHHLPADRTRWQNSGMPIPERSDWGYNRESGSFDTEQETPDNTDTEDNADNTEDQEATSEDTEDNSSNNE